MLEEFQGGFGVVNKDVLPEEIILIIVNDNNIILDFKFNAKLWDFDIVCVVKN